MKSNKRIRKKRENKKLLDDFEVTGRPRRGFKYAVADGKLRRFSVVHVKIRVDLSDEAKEALSYLQQSLL
jgi:hypothetical protein